MCRVIWRIDEHGRVIEAVFSLTLSLCALLGFNRASTAWITQSSVAWLPSTHIAERRGVFSSFFASEGVWDGKACGMYMSRKERGLSPFKLCGSKWKKCM
jgi:hypothetical protein